MVDRATWSQLVSLVCHHSGLRKMDLEGRGREYRQTAARHVLMFLGRKHTNYSLADIGGLLGGRDHSTVHYGCRRIEKDIGAGGKPPLEGIVRLIREVEGDLAQDITRVQITWEVVDLDPTGENGGPPMLVCRYVRGDGSHWLFTRQMTRLQD